jgi:hypothetical protein
MNYFHKLQLEIFDAVPDIYLLNRFKNRFLFPHTPTV